VTSDQPTESGNNIPWRPVYVAVISYTLAILLLLWLFSRYFAA
jgi:hypothetical protein